MASAFAVKFFSRSIQYNFTSNPFMLLSVAPTFPTLTSTRDRGTSKHWDPKWRKLRAKKVLKVTLPDFDENRRDSKLTIEEMRSRLKEKGIAPHREWNEKPFCIGCSASVFDPYVPPEGDGKISLVSSPGVKQKYEVFGKKTKSYMALRKIRNLDYQFDVPTIAAKANEIYLEAQKALSENNEDRLHELVTEKCYPEMMDSVKNKTIRWKFIQSLEPPRGVHVRCETLISKGNLFGQVTVRLHTQQTLAIYDRFGRLMHGSEDTVKDVLEYIVFEKFLTSEHGVWRIHAKIIPDWAPDRSATSRTFLMPDIEKEFPLPPEEPKQIDEDSQPETATNQPALA